MGEARQIHALVRKHKLPPGVKTFELEFGEDSEGDPAVWVWFIVDDDLNPSPEKVSKLNKLARSVTTDIRSKIANRWPYVQFRAAA